MSYKIHRWDAVTSNNIMKYPMIYVEPDLAFDEFARMNDYVVYVTVKGSNSTYDNRTYIGFINSSAYYPSCRPNYYNATKLWTITLSVGDTLSIWNGYPAEMGYVDIVGLETRAVENQLVKEDYTETDKPINAGGRLSGNKGFCNYTLAWIIFTLILIILMIVLTSYFLKKNKQ